MVIVTKGRARVSAVGDEVEAVAPAIVEVPAGEDWTVRSDSPNELLVLVLDEQ